LCVYFSSFSSPWFGLWFPPNAAMRVFKTSAFFRMFFSHGFSGPPAASRSSLFDVFWIIYDFGISDPRRSSVCSVFIFFIALRGAAIRTNPAIFSRKMLCFKLYGHLCFTPEPLFYAFSLAIAKSTIGFSCADGSKFRGISRLYHPRNVRLILSFHPRNITWLLLSLLVASLFCRQVGHGWCAPVCQVIRLGCCVCCAVAHVSLRGPPVMRTLSTRAAGPWDHRRDCLPSQSRWS